MWGRRLVLAPCIFVISFCDEQPPAEIRIVGAGFSRSGTTTLDKALRQLGYTVYHGTTFHERHRDWALWASAVEDPKSQTKLWNHLLAAGFDTFLDSPSSDLWASQLAHSPAARVIFSRRDPAVWAQSLLEVRSNPYVPHHGWWRRRPFKWMPPFSSLRTVMEFVHLNDCGWKHCGEASDEEQVASVLRAHEDRLQKVQAEVPEGQLLLWDPSEGWAPLCAFLRVDDCPKGDLPVMNERKLWMAQAEKRGKATKPRLDILEWLWAPVVLAVVLCIRHALWVLFAGRWKKGKTGKGKTE
mmetsp:Transcript_32937/g.83278  ORF Transcript_32937/g.83278 Transcript_32937/m.83278 type:complete len:298 (-) Transcript_32937:54-947(-)